jgi:putative restriction endonuclease
VSDLANRLSLLSPKHREALEWFHERQGDLIEWPKPLDGLFLVERAKGIRVPAGWEYALSIRQTLGSSYADEPPVRDASGGWTYKYFQEGKEPEARDRFRSNRAMLACSADQIPIAVLIQEKSKPKAAYRVVGLARVLEWTSDGFFHLEGFNDAGEIAPAENHLTDRHRSVAVTGNGGDEAEIFDPMSVEDARRRIDAHIVARQGGQRFRKGAFTGFGGKCAISECAIAAVLEAAHIVPFLGAQTNTYDNALLLRADLHTLFDRELLQIDPATLTVQLDSSLMGSTYADLAGKLVSPALGVSTATLRARLVERAKKLNSMKSVK